MVGSTFQTNPFDLNKLLDDCHCGTLQLPDFQRSWVWDEDRIKSLIRAQLGHGAAPDLGGSDRVTAD